MKKGLLIISLIIGCSSVWAQEYGVTGILKDGEDGSPVVGATIFLVNVKDSTIQYATASDEMGKFEIRQLSQAFFKLTITSIGYVAYAQYVRVTGLTELGLITLQKDTKLLDEVNIKGEVVPVEIRGDTTSMSADAYKTNPDAKAEDLIAKMPGIIVNQGQVQAQGENVQKVLVDGKEFFSNDPTLALRNIPAEIIDKIEVFDQQSEQSQFSGFDDGNTTKTINIVTRQEMRNGDFGRLYAGGGTDERYSLGGNFNSFNETRRLSVLGMMNNINQQNFSGEDLLGVASGRTSRGRRGGGGSGSLDNFASGNQSGIAATKAFGINLDEQIGEKIKINGSYFFNQVRNDLVQQRSRETFLNADSSQIYQELSTSESLNRNHRLTLRMEYSINERNSLLFTPTFSYQENESMDFQDGLTLTPSGDSINSSLSYLTSERQGFTTSGNLLFRHRFEKRGRTFSLNLSGSLNDNEGKSVQESANQYYLTDRKDSINQWVDSNNPGSRISLNAIYTEPLGDKAQLQFNYAITRQDAISERETYQYDPLNEIRQGLDTALSNNFNSTYETHRPTVGIMLRGEKMMLRGGISYQYARLQSEQEFPQKANINRQFNNVLPSLMMRYSFSKTRNLRMFYRSSVDAPSVSQLQNVVDNSDPLFLSIGNPNLGQSMSNFLVSRYSSTNPDKSTTFFLLANVRNQMDYITNATFILNQDSVFANGIEVNRGTQVSAPINLDGYWNVRTLATYGFPLSFIKSNLNSSLGFTYIRTPGFINDQENVSNSYNYTGGLVLGSNISENVDFTLSYTVDYTQVQNSLQPQLNDDYISQTFRGKVNLIFGKGFVFRSDLSLIRYSGYSNESLNQQFILWNASIGKKFLKDDRGEFKLSVFDLLKENVSISRINTESYFEEMRTNVLQQYFMATFTYTVRNFSAASKEPSDRPDQFERRRPMD